MCYNVNEDVMYRNPDENEFLEPIKILLERLVGRRSFVYDIAWEEKMVPSLKFTPLMLVANLLKIDTTALKHQLRKKYPQATLKITAQQQASLGLYEHATDEVDKIGDAVLAILKYRRRMTFEQLLSRLMNRDVRVHCSCGAVHKINVDEFKLKFALGRLAGARCDCGNCPRDIRYNESTREYSYLLSRGGRRPKKRPRKKRRP